MKSAGLALLLGTMLALPASAHAQTATQEPTATSRTDIGTKRKLVGRGHIVVWGSGGLDLDVIGDVTGGAVGTVRNTPTLVSPTAFPDVYVRTQRRRSAGIAIGIFDTVEVFGRYSDTNNPAATVIIGQFGSSTTTFPVAFDNYKDRAMEFGLRKYLGASSHTREYLAIFGGIRTVDPINLTLQVPGGAVTSALYGRSRVTTYGADFGITLEFGRVGLFVEAGMRYQPKLVRDDSMLALYGLEDLNNTGIRLFMPTSAGLLVRF